MKKRVLTITIILSVLLFGSGITYSLFQSSASMTSDNQNVASFIFNAQVLSELNLPLVDLVPGEVRDYDFEVSNQTDELKSNVNIEYQISIKTYRIVPLEIELYSVQNDTTELVMKCDEAYSNVRNLENEIVCTSQTFSINYDDVDGNDAYQLKVFFDDEYTDAKYAELVDFIDLEIQSSQIVD